MSLKIKHKVKSIFQALLLLILTICNCLNINASDSNQQFVVVLDAGHGGKDIGANDNNAKEKDINLAVALKVGELCKKNLKHTKVVFTRDDDTFVSLQGRAEIANKAKGNLFISIHTNSVDAKNKNRRSVAGASVYTQGLHKDDANMEVARRENSVIELENGYEQKYSGFDPAKDESYIIFEMAQKKNLAESARFAKSVQQNLVKYAGRRDRGVHQAGFWVLWSTSMPSVLVELDFICNPESATFMTSKKGVEQLAEAIFESIKIYEQNFLQKQRMIANGSKQEGNHAKSSEEIVTSNNNSTSAEAEKKSKQKKLKNNKKKGNSRKSTKKKQSSDNANSNITSHDFHNGENEEKIVTAIIPEIDRKDLSHSYLNATLNQPKAKHAAEGRRRRSESSKIKSNERNLAVNDIVVYSEFLNEPEFSIVENNNPSLPAIAATKDRSHEITGSDEKKSSKSSGKAIKVNTNGKNKSQSEKVSRHAGSRKSLKSKSAL